MQTRPLTGTLGAEISGLDLAAPLEDAVLADVRAAMVRYGVVIVRDQELTPRQQLAFAERLGPIHYHPHVGGLPDLPQVMEILKTETDEVNFGSGWHTDQSFLPEPAMATCLYALEVPEAGGDTLFACMRNGYRTLSPGMRRLVDPLRTLNVSVAAQLVREGRSSGGVFGAMRTREARADEQPAEHPLVRRHPETGEPALYLGIHTRRLAEFTEAESRPLIDYLLGHLTRPENTCRVRWEPGTLALWDNRSVLHNAVNDYPGKRRRMHRITVAGDAPVGMPMQAAPRSQAATA